jgi:hypothetical protein
MATSLREAMSNHPNVSGIVLSLPAMAGNGMDQEWWSMKEKAVYMSLTTNPPYFRETLIVPSLHPAAEQQKGWWRKCYASESTWLDWALEVQGLPGLSLLLASEGSERYLAARNECVWD